MATEGGYNSNPHTNDQRHPEFSNGSSNDNHPDLIGWTQRKGFQNEGDTSAGPPRLDDIQMDAEFGYGHDEQATEGLIRGDEKLSHPESDQYENESNIDRDKHAGVSSIVVPTRVLSIVILVFVLITHVLLGRECLVASNSLMKAKKDGTLSSRAITSWRATPGNQINLRWQIKLTSKIEKKYLPSQAETIEFEVYGKPHQLQGGTKRLHVISPVNAFATEITNKGKRFMEQIPQKEVFIEGNDGAVDLEKGEEALSSLSDANDIPVCPIFDAGYAKTSVAKQHFAPTSLVIAQQFWNAAQVFHLFLLLCLYGVMTSQSFSSSSSSLSSVKKASQLVSEKTGKSILWCFFLILTILSVVLLPFSVYFTNPGGHAFAIIMTIISLSSIYFSAPNIRFALADLPPQCCSTPWQHPGALMQPKKQLDDKQQTYHSDDDVSKSPPISSNTFTCTNTDNVVVVTGRGLCKIELIAFLCNLASSIYNYNTSKEHVFPNWYKIFHDIDKWLGLDGGDVTTHHDVLNRFMYNMGMTKRYHLPLFIHSAHESTTGAHVFIVLWSIIPFIYVFYFMSMYVLAKRAPGVKIQRFLALYGVFHFLFLTDGVDYKYGRGLLNEISEYFHKNEVVVWRIAILLPIYQNVLSGHYRHASQQNKYVGLALHYFMAVWAIVFFVYQFLLNDCFLIPQWLMGKKRHGLLQMMFGWKYSYKIGYLGTCMVMVFVYGFMMFGGTWCHHVYVGPDEKGSRSVRVWKAPAAVALRNLVIRKDDI